jgi:hypothetical protein
VLKPSHSSHLPAHEDGTECSETSDYKIQTPGDYTEESEKHFKCNDEQNTFKEK